MIMCHFHSWGNYPFSLIIPGLQLVVGDEQPERLRPRSVYLDYRRTWMHFTVTHLIGDWGLANTKTDNGKSLSMIIHEDE